MPFLPLIVCAVLAAPVEEAMSAAADYVAAEDFESARRVLEEAYAADPRPELLYSRAQVERQAGNCEEAQRLFEQFAAAASEEDAADARRLSAQCTPAERPPPTEPAEPVATTPPPVVPEPETTAPAPSTVAPDPEPAEPTRPWSRHPLPGALMGVGVGAIGAGVGLLAYAAVNPPDPEDASDEGDYGELVAGNRRLSVAGVAMTAVGAGLAVSAGVIWGVLARRGYDVRLEGSRGGLSLRF